MDSYSHVVSVVIWASIGVFSKNNGDDNVADSTKSLVKAILGVARYVFIVCTYSGAEQKPQNV